MFPEASEVFCNLSSQPPTISNEDYINHQKIYRVTVQPHMSTEFCEPCMAVLIFSRQPFH